MFNKPLTVGMVGENVAALHQALAALGLSLPEAETKRRFFGPGTREAVKQCQARSGLTPSGICDEGTGALLNLPGGGGAPPGRLRPAAPAMPVQPEARLGTSGVEAWEETFTVEGKVVSPLRAGVGGLRIEIVDKNVRQDAYLAEAVTYADGTYRSTFPITDLHQRGKQKPDLQARAFAGKTFIGASEVRYNASNREMLNILLTKESAPALPSEHETLTGALSAHVNGNLRDLKETDECQDITYLANKTGWDARAVALAALADQFSQRSGRAEIPPVFFYALFRAGLPPNEETLYHTDMRTLEMVWQRAAEQGVIPKARTQEIPGLMQRFQTLSAQKLLTGPALAGVSPLQEILTVSRLDATRQQQFAELYAAHRADMPMFWKAVTNAFGAETAKRLQLDGKLGFLTLNHAPLMQELHKMAGDNGLTDSLQLAQRGYHRAAQWNRLLTANIPIPKEIPGDTLEVKRANYADYLAAQVRLSYPTAAVAQMVQSGELPLTGAAQGISDQVHTFLTEHQGKFEIGVQPVQQYIARNKLKIADETVTQVKRLQRVYQLTPSDQAMIGLMNRGIDAAYHVVRYEKEAFVQTYQQELGGPESAAQTYDKSVQVHNAVLNIAISYLTAKNGIGLGAQPLKAPQQASDTAGQILQPAPKGPSAENAADVIAYPTLEGLFGSMDFCACDHCRSVLSPAAYLVDLLLFIDQPVPPAGTENPQTVLFDRRPDIQHLPLTCENTNTALPYIDVVNETLEYFIANNSQKLSLKDYVGHATNGALSEDLLASPQFVMDSAYTTLRSERFPTPLPFHQPLENLRRYFAKFETPLTLAMERLRKSDDLERGTNPYGWRDILMEETGLSRVEYEILTDSTVVPLWRMYGFPNGTMDVDVIAALSNAKRFTRRVGIMYEDMVAILKTRFVNPNSDLIPKLERLGVSFSTLKALKDGTITDAAFDALLPTGAGALDPAAYSGNVNAPKNDYTPIRAWVKNDANYARIIGLITLTDPTDNPDPCNFDDLEFRYAKPMTNAADTSTRLGAAEFVRLLRFIRLWQKLGWTIEQTDAAICAFYRADMSSLSTGDIDTAAKLDAGFLTLLPRVGIVVRVMKALNLTPKRDLLPLLACWSEIGTHGDSALYRQMFLNPALLKQDDVFADNGYGEFLKNNPINPVKLADHAEALRSAFNLTDDEYDRIVTALFPDTSNPLIFDANTPLTIPNISAVFRLGYLARKLRLSVRELLVLIKFTGLDPFAAPSLTDPEILRLVSLVQALKDQPLKSAAALYLIWNQNLSGKSDPDPAQVTEFARTLRGDFASIEDQFAATEDPGGDIARARMTLVYGQEAADAFFALLDDTLVLDVAYTHPAPTLEAAITAADPKIAYDDFRHRLAYTGVFTAAHRDTLKMVSGVTAFQAVVDALFARSEDLKGSFFARYPELQPLYDAYLASADPPATKRSALLAAFRPELSRRRKRQQVLQRLSAAVTVDLTFAQTILDPTTTAYPLHAFGHVDQPVLDDVLALETPGLAAQFFFRDTATGAVGLNVPSAADLDYASGGNNPLPANPTPGAAISGIWRGQVEAPESGFYNFVIEVDRGATVGLTLGGQARPLTQHGNVYRNTDPLELKAGTLYEIVLTVEKVTDTLKVKWETPKRAREVIPARYLYPPTILAPFSDAYIRFLKTASLAAGLGLTASEMAHFATDSDYLLSGDGWLNALPVSGDPAAPIAVALLKPLRDLLDYARIKAAISPGDESLLTVIQDPIAATANADSLLFTLTRWDRTSLNDLLAYFGGNVAGLTHFDQFRRVYDAFALIQKMGIAAKALMQATTNEPVGNSVRDFQAALRARYDATAWRDVVQPINDTMRGLQRDALVAYILHQMRSNPATDHIDTADKLFEYFLMDVQMEPCMQTSRIRHALSSVQLFIERCLMNLEPRVSPASLNAKQWEWMKRYRVWEANRKVFLFPENWLEPELRDDKSPFFKEIESELLQSDITEDSATSALLNYLSKLEEVAKLEPCGIYHLEGDPSQRTGNVDHVIARTAGAHCKYYYRRYENGYWTPWEQVKLDIEDNPVIPVVWKGRLLLFWLRILKQTPLSAPQLPTGHLAAVEASSLVDPDVTKMIVQAILCWSEYYNGKWQPTKTSHVNLPTELGRFEPAGQNSFDRSKLRLSVFEEEELDTLVVNIFGEGGSTFRLYNTHTLPEAGLISMIDRGSPTRTLATLSDTLAITYDRGWVFYLEGSTPLPRTLTNNVLKNQIGDRTVEPRHNLQNPWLAPFFYEDARHVFYVTTAVQQVLISDHSGIGVTVNPGFKPTVEIPPLILEIDPRLQVGPKFWGDGGPIGPNPGVVDPAPMQRFVTEDAYIRQGIGTTGSVMYGDKQIAPSGAIADVRSRM
jgi:peptidoglycan hydrolase-like protein with peptidoglycan-binding domain